MSNPILQSVDVPFDGDVFLPNPVQAGSGLLAVLMVLQNTGGYIDGGIAGGVGASADSFTPLFANPIGSNPCLMWFCANAASGLTELYTWGLGVVSVYEIAGATAASIVLNSMPASGETPPAINSLGPTVDLPAGDILVFSLAYLETGGGTPASPEPGGTLLDSTSTIFPDYGYSTTVFLQAQQIAMPSGGSFSPEISESASMVNWIFGVAAVTLVAPGLPGSAANPVGDIVADLCVRAGLDPSQFDTSLLTQVSGSPAVSLVFPTNIVPGYILERMTTAAAAIKELMVAYFFGCCESDGVLKFVPRTFLTQDPNSSPAQAFAISEADLGLADDKAKLEETFSQEQDLPLAVTVLYNDVALNWQQGKQIKQRNAQFVTTRQQQVLSLPLSLDDTTARQIAEVTLYSTWQTRQGFTTNLWRAIHMLVDPTDIIYMVYEGQSWEVRVTQNTVGLGFVTALRLVSEDIRNYGSMVQGVENQSFLGGELVMSAPTFLWLFDIPLLQDADSNPAGSGFYAAMSSNTTGWPGAALDVSSDDASFTQLDSSTAPATFGAALNALGAPLSPWEWDTVNSLNINLGYGALAGDTEANVLAGSNAMIVGSEILQFVNAVQNTDGSWTVSQLLRGRRGTDTACGGHVTGETVMVVQAGGVLREAAPGSQIGALRYYRGVTVGQDVTSAADVDLTLAGNDLMCYSPVDLVGSIGSGGDLVITWTRRTRLGGGYGTGDFALTDGMGGPVSEATEAYEVDIYAGSPAVVVRTLTASSPTVTYTQAQQIADLGSPMPGSVEVMIYQMSATVGRGFPGAATLEL